MRQKVGIKKGDEVEVIAGKDRGRRGRIVHVLPKDGRVMVEGVARAKKHTRTSGRRSTSGSQLQQGGIIDTELFIDISNVMVVCKNCSRPTRVGRRSEEGVGTRVCRRCGAEL
jgi:large subunit ribosomal protein L24